MAKKELDEFLADIRGRYTSNDEPHGPTDVNEYLNDIRSRTYSKVASGYPEVAAGMNQYASSLNKVASRGYTNYLEYSDALKNEGITDLAISKLQRQNRQYNRALKNLLGDQYDPSYYNAAAYHLNELSNATQRLSDFQKDRDPYGKYTSDPDFPSLSRYNNSVYGSGYNAKNAYDVNLYAAVNGDDRGKKYFAADSEIDDPAFIDSLQYMTDYQKQVFNYIYAKEGAESAKNYLTSLSPALNEEQRRVRTENAQEWAGRSDLNRILASAQSVALAPFRGAAYVGQLGDLITNGKIDQNAGYNSANYLSTALRSGASEGFSDTGNFLYQTGMSMGDFLFNTLVSGGFGSTGTAAKIAEWASLGLMGTGAAADAVIESKDNGMSDAAAFALGTVAGAAEIVTEKVSLENLLGPNRVNDSTLKYIIKNILAEGSEEAASDVINNIADDLVTLFTNEPTKLRRKLEETGGNWYKVLADYGKEIGLDFLGGALSGGVMATAGSAIDYVRQAKAGKNILADEEGLKGVFNLANSLPNDTPAYQLGQVLKGQEAPQNRLEQIAYNRQIGRLNEMGNYEVDQALKGVAATKKAVDETRAGKRIKGELKETLKENQYAKSILGVNEKAKKSEISRALQERTTAIIAAEKSNVDQYAEALGTVGRKVLSDMYDAQTQNALNYIKDATNYYNMAADGKFVYNEDSYINEVQAKAMYEAGAEDIKGGTYNGREGEGVLSSGAQRNDGAGTGVETGGVQEVAGTSEAGQSKSGSRPRAIADVVYGQSAVTAKELGARNGAANVRNLYTVESGGTEGMRRLREFAESRGVKTVYFAGGNLNTITKDGKLQPNRAMYDPETRTIYVRVDHNAFSAEQLGMHELAHDMINQGEIDVQDAVEAIKEMFPGQELEQMLKEYAEIYGLMGYNTAQIWEEIICDSVGGMNSFAIKDVKLGEKYAPYMQGVRSAAQSTARVEPAVNTHDSMFSREIMQDYEDTKNDVSFSQATQMDASGVDVYKDPDTGKVTYTRRTDGKKLTKGEITPEYIRDHSAIGVLINAAYKSGLFAEDDRFKNPDGSLMTAEQQAQNQYEAAAELANTIINTNDTEMVWEFTGATMFSSLKQNSDGQYTTTVDFSTVCRKTVAMINAMTAAMKTKAEKTGGKGGLTKGEVVRLQAKVNAAGAEVNCPVCYVFSRWAGIGTGVLDEIYDLQKKFEGYSVKQLKARTEELRQELIKAKLATQTNKGYRVSNAQSAQMIEDKREKRTKVQYQIDLYENNAPGKCTEAQYKKYQEELVKLNEDISLLGEWIWTSSIASDPDYEPVPSNILYDLNAGELFASKYAPVWRYRTTRGPAAGKAILPYSPMRYGDIILGATGDKLSQNRGVLKKDGKYVRGIFTTESNKEGENNKSIIGKNGFTAAQQKAYEAAKKRTRAQNLIGGQRYQSTSDFRYEYALDYILSFFELQALGSKMQTYTKVVEFADMVAAIGGDVNLSVMPFEKGYDENGNLVFSNVTGMDIDAAKEANAKFDNAQLILVGINDEHIRIALDDESGHGGEFIGFVIPYHSSGASKEEFIAKLVKNLGETFNSDYYQDYSDVQNDAFRQDVVRILKGIDSDKDKAVKAFLRGAANIDDDSVATQLTRYGLRRRILTGNYGKRNDIDAADVRKYIRGTNKDISSRSFEDLRAVEKKALAGDKEAIKEYLSWSAGVLNDLYEKMYNGEEKNTFLTSTQAEHIMPHEYWNKTVDRPHAYINNFIFRSYCYSLGLQPRFTGNNATDPSKRYGDFSDSKGYWKTLIDRPMYDLNNKYREQQRINVTNFNNRMLSPEYAKETYPDYYKDNSKSGIGFEVGRKFAEEDIKYSKEADLPYAPTFYSKLEREVENFKGDKIGAASAVQYLKGKGVKDEEIKWSGINTFLEGKKSVSKQELLDFLRANRLEVQEITNTDGLGGPLVDSFTDEVYDNFLGFMDAAVFAARVEEGVSNEEGNDTINRSDIDYERDDNDIVAYYMGNEILRAKPENPTKWRRYTVGDGDDYTEYLFTLPGNNYSNNAMQVHWGKDDVLAHARVQTFSAEQGGEVLFIEEIQSDWHNAGAKNGYMDAATTKQIRELRSKVDDLAAEYYRARLDFRDKYAEAKKSLVVMMADGDMDMYNASKQIANDIIRTCMSRDYSFDQILDTIKVLGDFNERSLRNVVKKIEIAVQADNAMVDADDAAEIARMDLEKLEGTSKTPDAPFRETYTDFVLKNLLRKAAEGDFDYLAWTTGEMQEKRWSSEYAEGYRIEYDQQIPSFLKRYGKQWGAKLTEVTLEETGDTVPAIEITDEMKESVLYSGQPMFSKASTYDDVYEENRALRQELTETRQVLKRRTEQKEYWKGQTKVTENPTLRKDDVNKLAKSIQKSYNSDADISNDLKKLGENLLKNMLNESMSLDQVQADAKKQAEDIARKLLQGTKTLNDYGYGDIYKGIKQTLKNTKIYVPQEIRSDISPDYEDFRKSMFGTMTLTSDPKAQKIDELYAELRDQYGDYLFPEDITHEAEMISQIVDVLNNYKPVLENMSTNEIASAVEYVADELIESILSDQVRQTNPTYADKMEKKIAELKQKANASIKKAREQRDSAILKLRQHYAEVALERRNRKVDSEARSRLLKIAKRLNNMKLPAVSREYLKQVIGDLDLVAKGITGKKITELMAKKEQYEQLKKEDPYYEDEHIENLISRLEKRRIADMTQEEVAELTEILLSFEHEIRTRNKAIESQMKHDFYVAGVQTVGDIKQSAGKKNEFLDKFVTTQTLTPEREVRRVTGYFDNDPMYQLTQELSTGQRNAQDYMMRAYSMFTNWTNNKMLMKKWAGKNAEEITVKGIDTDTGEETSVKITPAMRISLYLHSQNRDNIRHIVNGGINIPDISAYKKGDVKTSYSNGKVIRFTPQMLAEITSKMTEEEKAFARQTSKYFNEMSRNAINATSEDLVGYSIAGVENYFPIRTDKSFTSEDMENAKATSEMSDNGYIKNMGFTKERVKASNAIVLFDATTVLNMSIAQHAKYVGLAIPVRNFNKLWNGRSKESSVRKALDQKWGDTAVNYVRKMISDVQVQSFASDDFSEAFAKLRSKYAQAVLTLNPAVAIKQTASYPTAAAVIGWEPLIKALKDRTKVDTDLIAKYTPDYWYRAQGFSTDELGDIAKQGHKIPMVLNWIQGMDLWTTRRLWLASEYYVQDVNKTLVKGTDAYYKAVAEVYNRVIEQTQPNYAVMQRPQVLRSEADLTRALNMFKTQPFQNFNILYDAVGNYKAKQRQYTANATEENAKALGEAKTALVRAISSQLVSAFIFALMQAIWDWARNKDKKYRDDEGDLSIINAIGGMSQTGLSSVAGMVPFGGTVLELGEALADLIATKAGGSAIFDQSFYGISENGTGMLNDAAKNFLKLSEFLADTAKGEKDAEDIIRAVFTYGGDVAQMFGMPVNNIVNMGTAIAGKAGQAVGMVQGGKYVADYNALRIIEDPAKHPADYYDLLYRAYKNDYQQYSVIYQKMLDDGFTEDKIKTNIEKRMKKAQGVNSVKDLSERWLPPGE